MKIIWAGFVCVSSIAVITSCSKLMPSEPESHEVLAEPLAELTPGQNALHVQGDEEFARIFGVEDGLGPVFVQNSCESCHVGDGKGNRVNNLTRFGRYNPDGTWNPVPELGGPQLQHRSIPGFEPEKLPENVASTQFIAPNVTGLGYLAAVTDAEILSRADPLDADGDGISGTVNYITAPEWLNPDPRYHQQQPNGKYIGRFGRKAAAIDLTMQTVGAYKQDMGITSDFDPVDPVNHQESPFADDHVGDPEVPAATVNKVVFYLQTLEAPRRREANNPEVVAGEQVFNAIGCEKCHTAEMRTGPSEVVALDRVTFYPYTDMLLHDMGPALDDSYTEGTAETSEWRTLPLWGLGLQQDSQGGRIFLMHDGRAGSYDEAIMLHGGEAADSRIRYQELTDAEQSQLVKFLNSL